MTSPLLEQLLTLPTGGRVLDIGCESLIPWRESQARGRGDLLHAGVDYCAREVPPGYEFRPCNLEEESIPFEDDSFDLVIASHVLEHLSDGIRLFAECARVCKPGGVVFLEAPSERSQWLPGWCGDREPFYSLSFYDDPTHRGRPWSPQSFFRLARLFSCEPLRVGYRTSTRVRLLLPLYLLRAWLSGRQDEVEACLMLAVGWASHAAIRKPASLRGAPPFRYYVPPRPGRS